ncbi:MAG: hypothetical protein U9R16_02210 [Campylobacterota bacterium]|nr:hypothetical protein [Campylobacterota bacterium]
MAKPYGKKMDKFQKDIKSILDVLTKDYRLIIDIIEDCSQKSVLEAKQALNADNISNSLNKLDSKIVDMLSLKETSKDEIKMASIYLKVNSDLSKVSSKTRTVITELESCCRDLENKAIRKYAVKIYKNIIKSLNSLNKMIDHDDEDEITDLYEQIVILEFKTDNIYEDINRYIMKEFCGKDSHEAIMKVFRKSETIAARTLSAASLIKFGN